jgi:hypothetical protein
MESEKTHSVQSPLVCSSCGYALRGLPLEGVCPECGTEIQASVHAAVDAAHAAEMRARPLTGWLRVARSGYIAAWSGCVLSPVLVPPLGLVLNYRNLSAFHDALAMCAIATIVLGLFVSGALADHKKRQSMTVLWSIVLLFVYMAFWPAIGR